MARAGVGVDMLEIKRMERAISRHPSFLQRVFTEEERIYCEGTARPTEHYAARFAAREATLKALGTGFSQGGKVRDVSVGRDSRGRPVAVLTGRAAEVAAEQGVQEVLLSLSHTHEVAVANAVAMTDDVRPKADETTDPLKELQASFKQARSVIDELERLQDGILDTLDGEERGEEEPAMEQIPFADARGSDE